MHYKSPKHIFHSCGFNIHSINSSFQFEFSSSESPIPGKPPLPTEPPIPNPPPIPEEVPQPSDPPYPGNVPEIFPPPEDPYVPNQPDEMPTIDPEIPSPRNSSMQY